MSNTIRAVVFSVEKNPSTLFHAHTKIQDKIQDIMKYLGRGHYGKKTGKHCEKFCWQPRWIEFTDHFMEAHDQSNLVLDAFYYISSLANELEGLGI